MKQLHPEKGLIIYDIKWEVTTAGPSPNDNKRVEVFLLGCNKAMSGNPCKGCFNSPTWDKDIAEWSRDPIEVADMINEKSPDNKYVTIGGGEPTDQLPYLIPFVKRLKEHGFHILMYTWRDVIEILKQPFVDYSILDQAKNLSIMQSTIFPSYFREVTKYIDVIIDGEYLQEERLWNPEDKNKARNFIGSGNQTVWDVNYGYGYKMRDLDDISLINDDDEDNALYYKLKDEKSFKECLKEWRN